MKIVNGTKKYSNTLKEEKIALDNININFIEKGLVIIYGESGSGKSTLLNVISGIENLDTGEVIMNDDNKRTSFIFQDFQLIEYLTVFDNLSLVTSSHSNEDIKDVLYKVNMQNFINSRVNELSGGEKQRIAIARALLTNNFYYLCDEPTGNLDEVNAKKVSKILKEISENKLVIVVSHDKKLWIDIADQMIVLDNGKIVENKIYKNEKNNQSTNFSNDESTNLTLSNKKIFTLFKNRFKRIRNRFLIMILLLFITFSMIFVSLNVILNNDNKSFYKTLKEFNIDNITYTNFESSLYLNQIERLQTKYGGNVEYYNETGFEYVFNDELINNPSLLVHKIIISETYNNNVLSDNKIIISSTLLDNLKKLGFEDNDNIVLFGNTLNIIDTINNISIVPSILKDQYNKKNETSIIMNENTFFNINTYITSNNNKSVFKYAMDDSILSYEAFDTNKYSRYTILEGRNPLSKNEIIVSKKMLATTYNDLQINGTIAIDFYDILYDSIEKKISNNYIVVGVIDNTNDSQIGFYTDEFVNLNSKYGNHLIAANSLRGINFRDYDLKMITDLHKEGFVHDIYISDYIYSLSEPLEVLGIICLAISILIVFITILLFVNYIDNSIKTSINEIGILKSLSFKSDDIVKLFNIEVYLLIIVSVFLSIPFSIILISLTNKLILSLNMLVFNWLNIELLLLLIIALVSLIITYFFTKIMTNRLKKIKVINLLKNRI